MRLSTMSEQEISIRVADLDELPPGRGKLVQTAGIELVVVNTEGKLQAYAIQMHHHAGPLAGIRAVGTESTCSLPGSHFDIDQEDSPYQLRNEQQSFVVEVIGNEVRIRLPSLRP